MPLCLESFVGDLFGEEWCPSDTQVQYIFGDSWFLIWALHTNNDFGHLIFKCPASSLNLTKSTHFQLERTKCLFETHSHVSDHKIMIVTNVSISEFACICFVETKKQLRTRMKSFLLWLPQSSNSTPNTGTPYTLQQC